MASARTREPGAGYAVSSFATDLGPVIDIVFGPHGTSQALYYTAWKPPTGRSTGSPVSGNRTPVPVAQANPRFGSVPLTVSFMRGSTDPDGDALTYDWDFGDGTPHATTVNASHTYSQAGTYTATLRTRDSRGASASASLRIDAGNSPPAPSIISSTTARFYTGQTITLRGTAGDFEDRGFCCRLSWEVVLLRHNTHFHPFLERIGNDISFTTPSPESLADAASTYLQIRLTATDSKGLARTVTQDLRPEL